MLSGRRLDLLEPSPDDIEIGDVAHGLARVARWNGQTAGPHIFSVAQHCLLVEALAASLAPGAPVAARLTALLHDAPEYVIGDLISPFKTVVGENYRAVEARILAAVHVRFGLPDPSPGLRALVKRADRAAAFLEATRLAGFARAEAVTLFGPDPGAELDPDPVLLRSIPSEDAHRRFLARFEALAPPASGRPE